MDERWNDVDAEMARLVFDQAGTFLSAQLEAGIAADQRATSVAATFCGFAGAILAATFGFDAGAQAGPEIVLAGLVAGFGFLIAAACSFYSARPVDFEFAGNQPENWYDHLKTPIPRALIVEADNYGDSIGYNEGILANNAAWLARGFWCAILTPVVATVVYFVSPFCLA